MQKRKYQIGIQAPAEKVFSTMLNKLSYEKWASAFGPGSSYEGKWEKGGKVYLVGTNEGKIEGCVARVVDFEPYRFFSVEPYGAWDGENEITEGPAAEAFAGVFEKYSFEENDGITTVVVDITTDEASAAQFDKIWPKALDKLKALSE